MFIQSSWWVSIAEYGWGNAYLVFGIIILVVVTALLGLLLRNYPADKGLKPFGGEKVKSRAPKLGRDYKVAKTPVFYSLLVFAFLMIAVSKLNLFLPNYITGIGYTVEQSALSAKLLLDG